MGVRLYVDIFLLTYNTTFVRLEKSFTFDARARTFSRLDTDSVVMASDCGADVGETPIGGGGSIARRIAIRCGLVVPVLPKLSQVNSPRQVIDLESGVLDIDETMPTVELAERITTGFGGDEKFSQSAQRLIVAQGRRWVIALSIEVQLRWARNRDEDRWAASPKDMFTAVVRQRLSDHQLSWVRQGDASLVVVADDVKADNTSGALISKLERLLDKYRYTVQDMEVLLGQMKGIDTGYDSDRYVLHCDRARMAAVERKFGDFGEFL